MGLTFKQKLEQAMERADGGKGISRHALGRRLRPDKPENGRRLVQKYLAETNPDTPRAQVRHRFADALDAPELLDDSDEEDAEMAAALQERLLEMLSDMGRDIQVTADLELAHLRQRRDAA